MGRIKPIKIDNFKGGLNLSTSSDIGDNQFQIATNMFYNQKWQIQTRYWYTTFGNAVWTGKPITSYFFFQRDDNLDTVAVCASWDNMYLYDETTGDWNSIRQYLHEYETLPEKTTFRTRWDFAVYKNVIYLCNGVDPYFSISWGTMTPIWLSALVTCTFDNTTNIVEKVAHWLTDWAQIWFIWWTLPAELEERQFYFVVNANTDDFQISLSPGWDPVAFTDDGSWTIQYQETTQPRYRYINMNTDRLYGTWEDLNPSTIYYTDAAPADGTDLTTNSVVVGWDELGRINGMNNLQNVMLALKSGKIYSIDVTNTRADAIDSQTGWYSDRSIANVWNSLVYLTDRWVDTLQTRTWVSWTTALETRPLDEDVRQLTTQIEEWTLNSNCWWYIKRLWNYYFSFDTNWDDVPDTTLVYNSMVKAWTKYTYPNLYDYWMYIDEDGVYKYVLASATTDQMYEIETWYTDIWEDIEYSLKTKAFDFWEPWTYKTYDYIDIIGQKSKWKDILVNIEVDWINVWWWYITDTNITNTTIVDTLWVRPIWNDTLTWESSEDIEIYNYIARIPLYSTWSNISVSMESTWWIRMLDKMRIWVNWEPIDVFWYANIV